MHTLSFCLSSLCNPEPSRATAAWQQRRQEQAALWDMENLFLVLDPLRLFTLPLPSDRLPGSFSLNASLLRKSVVVAMASAIDSA